MRALAIIFLLTPSFSYADQILTASKITAVTVFPGLAQVTREVVFDAPAGTHQLLITDLPAETWAEAIRLTAGDGTTFGAFSLRTDRLPPRDEATDPALLAAKAEIETMKAAEQSAQAALEAVLARISAAEAQAAFLANAKADSSTMTPDNLKGIAQMIGTEVLAAKQTALAAKADLPPVYKALDDATKNLTRANEAYAALSQRDVDYTGLTIAVQTEAAGPHSLTVTHYVNSANWQPVYDMLLTRADEDTLTIRRGVLVSQETGEDWSAVALKLSTARPNDQVAPRGLWPSKLRIYKPEAKMAYEDEAQMGGMAEPVMEPVSAIAGMSLEGGVVVYSYPTPVDVASGVENLRLELDELQMIPNIKAFAVPRQDSTAFLMASFTNASPEILLPGPAFLQRDGTYIGSQDFPVTVPGDTAEVAFGAIDGLQLTRDMPQRAEGDRGILSSSTQREEAAVLKVENLTGENWPIRLLDQVPYSEQEDLEITYDAAPQPTETDVKGQRGILAWEFDLPAGETKEITLTHQIRWPAGMELE